MKVYISPSTQENNKTALGNTEENIMHKVADELVPILVENGIVVLRGKKTDSLEQMVRDSNTFKPDIHVALHSNAYDTKTRGTEVFHYPTSTNGKKLAEKVYKYLTDLSPVPGRGIKVSSVLYELKNTTAPAILIEVEFHDNIEGAKWIDANYYNIAVAIAKGICDYFGVPYKSNDKDNDKNNGKDKYKDLLFKIRKEIDDILGEA